MTFPAEHTNPTAKEDYIYPNRSYLVPDSINTLVYTILTGISYD